MSESHSTARIVLTTAANPDEARRLAQTLVDERLAACATVIPSVESMYRWQGQIESSTEALLLLKTTAEQIGPLQTRVHQLHSYQTPEFLVLSVESGSAGYIDWLHSSLRKG
jgi:periplasmic divalent cation tolerance protein